jgi:hypothetical protein
MIVYLGSTATGPWAAPQDRTTTILNGLSPVDRYHSSIFLDLAPGSRPLDTLNDVLVTENVVSLSTERMSVEDYVTGLTCSNDAAVVGQVMWSTSLPTSDGQFLFTTYQLQALDRVWQAKAGEFVVPAIVTLVRPGGEMKVNGSTVKATHGSYPPLARGDRYLLLLDYLNETGAFASTNGSATFRLTSGGASLLGPSPIEELQRSLPTAELEAMVSQVKCPPKVGA